MRHLLAGAMALVLGPVLAAQATLTISPKPPTAGTVAIVTYSNPALHGQTVTVTIDNGGSPASVQTLQITLDADGNGSKGWLVPWWTWASLNAPGVVQQNTSIVFPPE